MLDLELVPVRSAPGAVVKFPIREAPPVTVEVIEPEDRPSAAPKLLPPSVPTYRIPRRSPPPAPVIKKKVQRLSRRKAAVLADKVNKQEAKARKKVCPRSKRYCKICKLSCNSSKTFYDHKQSRAHRIRVENAKKTPECTRCDRIFESHEHLQRHLNGAAHLKVVLELKI